MIRVAALPTFRTVTMAWMVVMAMAVVMEKEVVVEVVAAGALSNEWIGEDREGRGFLLCRRQNRNRNRRPSRHPRQQL